MATASRRTVRKKLPCRPRQQKSPRPGPPPAAAPIPRISRLMALAVVFEEMLQRGEVKDYAELARIGHVSPARITQVMGLLNVAPSIQEQLLILPPTAEGQERITERSLRPLLNTAHWAAQIKVWEDLKGASDGDSKAAEVCVV